MFREMVLIYLLLFTCIYFLFIRFCSISDKNSVKIFYSVFCFHSVTYMIRFLDIFVRKVSLFRS